jgi:hypothetical protein
MSTDAPGNEASSPSEQPSPSVAMARTRFGDFCAGLAGFHLELLPNYVGADIEHERTKLTRIGGSVLLPSFLSLGTTYFLLAPYVASPTVRVALSLIAALVILRVDSLIVTTLPSSGRAGIVARLLLSLCLSVVIADPLVAALFHKEITAYTEAQLGTERTAEESKLETKLSEDDGKIAHLNEQMSGDRARLQDYAPGNLALTHFKASAALREELVGGIRTRKAERDEQLNGQLKELRQQRLDLETQIERTIIDLEQERAGKRDSKMAGKGPVYQQLQEKLESLKQQERLIDDQLAAKSREIDEQRSDTREQGEVETRLKNESAALGSYESTGKLTPEEQAERDQLQSQVDGYQASLTALRGKEQQTQQELAQLPERFSISRRDDSLSQSKALKALVADSVLLQIKVGSLMLLFLLLDLTPVLTKLSVSTDYDEYIRSQRRARDIAGQPAREAFLGSVTDFAAKKRDRMADYGERSLQRLQFFDPGPSDSRYAKSAKRLMSEEILRQMREIQLATRGGQPEEKRPTPG